MTNKTTAISFFTVADLRAELVRYHGEGSAQVKVLDRLTEAARGAKVTPIKKP